MDILIFNIIIWVWKLTFQSEIWYLTSKNLFDVKIDTWILNYYFGILNLYFNSKNYWLSLKGFLLLVLSIINHFYKL
jgi:hypothetical protein